MRIGIDVGGTHTDAVVLDGDDIVTTTKALTTADVQSGVNEALDRVLGDSEVLPEAIEHVMIGTTQFTNAVVQRRDLAPAAALRIGLPSGNGLPPTFDWPDDIAEAVGRRHFQLDGGTLYDGRELAALDEAQIDAAIAALKKDGINNIAIAAAFSPMQPQPEQAVADRIRRAIPDARITLSHPFGRLGLLERENAALLNATLRPLADRVVAAFLDAVRERGLSCPVFISQNDGTLMSADFVRRYPALTFASGPTNSLRGACKLTGLEEAIVVDIGGTTSDIGVLHQGFPRESNTVIEVGGVRTNFRMPDILALGLGGGSLVSSDGRQVGPQSVGHRLVTEGLVFGGDTLTATDIVVAAGRAQVGEPARVANLDRDLVNGASDTMLRMLDRAVERMRPGGQPMPVILVGGGALLVAADLKAASQTLRPNHAGVANAIGAAIAQIGGEAERMVSFRAQPREQALASVTGDATKRAVAAGADPDSLRTVDIEETSVPYMDEGATRVRVKVVGDIARRERA